MTPLRHYQISKWNDNKMVEKTLEIDTNAPGHIIGKRGKKI